MSRYYGDDDSMDGDITNADCADCGVPFYRSEFDSCPWCGECAQRRDAWATAQEIRAMAKAVLSVDLTKIKEIA